MVLVNIWRSMYARPKSIMFLSAIVRLKVEVISKVGEAAVTITKIDT